MNKNTDSDELLETENNNTPYSNPELDMISKDIEELAREKSTLETNIAQKEADIKIKNGEIKSLKSELDTLAATLKQLENQKGEAQKRLNDLKAQRSTVDSELEDVESQLDEQQQKVDKLRSQANEQAEVLRVQESELTSKKEQLENLRKEEETLENQRQESDQQLNRLTTNLQDTQLHISQVKAKITQLQEQQRQMSDAIAICDSAIQTGDPYTVADTALRITPEFRDAEFTNVGNFNHETPITQQNGFGNSKNDPFSENNAYKSDPFKSNGVAPFSSNDPFASAFPAKASDGFSSDPFGAFSAPTAVKSDPFDPFGDGKKQSTTVERSPLEDEKDPFGCDPFAILHAPTRDGAPPGRPASPSPALPPKKSKQPPPRPAPPRPMQPPRPAPPSFSAKDPFTAPTNTASADPFASSSGFADFADFDSKFSNNKSGPQSQHAKKTPMDFTDDPFRDYRYEDPFNIADPFANDEPAAESFVHASFDRKSTASGRQSVPLPTASALSVVSSTSGRASAPLVDPIQTKLPSEDQQLVWAAEESLRLEEARRKKQLQEQADLEYAIALSRQETKKS